MPLRNIITSSVLLLILSAFFSVCQKGNQQPTEAGIQYVRPFVGLNLRRSPNQKSDVLIVLPYGARLKVLEEGETPESIDGLSGRWLKVEFAADGQPLIGYVYSAYLQSYAPENYATVKAPSGLRMRATPDQGSAALELLPAETTQIIESIHPRKMRIDGISGYWLKITFKEKPGWIFSGYTVISASRPPTFPVADKKMNTTRLLSARLSESPAGSLNFVKTIQKKTFGNFTVTVGLNGIGGFTGECGEKRIVLFEQSQTGRTFYMDYYSETITSENKPFPGLVATGFVGCCACCPWQGNQLYLLGEEEVFSFFIAPKNNYSAGCSYDAMMGITYNNYEEKRFDAARRIIYIYRKQPQCNVPDGTSPDDYWEQKDIRHFDFENFIVVDFSSGRPAVEEIEQEGIPEKHRPAWERATTLTEI